MNSDETQDVITRPQIGVKLIRDKEITSKLFDKNMEPIIIILREGPLTIKELFEKYNQLAEDPKSEITTKSEMTIYRYVKELDKIDIVKEVGKRIKTGQSASETLYGRTAKIFWNLTDKEAYWKSEDSKPTINAIRDLLSIYKENATINTENLVKLLTKTYTKNAEELGTFFDENDDAIDKIISGFSFKDVDHIFNILGTLILLMNSDDFTKELEECGC
ncbi:MAG: hypothetical protein KAU62_10150 [Candidatus Heimdallarchaeota archaeon]|nr:hypothetical protein [Candidatus Heimdallarchaeota archaeon]MCK4611505.1 hypothetical protein [Candidatus Heimdallarchaeota archaeon]